MGTEILVNGYPKSVRGLPCGGPNRNFLGLRFYVTRWVSPTSAVSYVPLEMGPLGSQVCVTSLPLSLTRSYPTLFLSDLCVHYHHEFPCENPHDYIGAIWVIKDNLPLFRLWGRGIWCFS